MIIYIRSFIFIISITLFSCTNTETAKIVDSPLSLWNEKPLYIPVEFE